MSFAYPVPTPIFPLGLRPGFSQALRPVFSTIVQTSVSGVETRSARQAYPLWEFELKFERLADQTQNQVPYTYYLNETELEQLCGLFLVCNGQYGRFYYSYPNDYSRSGQVLGTGDGITTDFTLVRTIGSGDLAFVEPVGGIDQTTGRAPTVYLNGVIQPFGWSIIDDRIVRFSSPPSSGVVVSADFYYYYFCRFIEDLVDFDMFYKCLWQVGALKFRSVKR